MTNMKDIEVELLEIMWGRAKSIKERKEVMAEYKQLKEEL